MQVPSGVSSAIGLAACVLLGAAEAAAVTTNLAAVADTYLRGGGAENTNEGSATFLRLQRTGSNRALLRFEQSAITSAVAGGTLQAATLEVTIEFNNGNWGAGRAIDAHRLLTSWTELGATWNCPVDSNTANTNADCAAQWNGGTFSPTAAATYTQTNTLTGVVAIDVTAEVAAFLGGAGNFGWLIKKRQENENGTVEFSSRDGVPGQGPRLILDVLIPPTHTPTRTPTATPTATNTFTPTATFTPSPTPTPDTLCGAGPLAGCRQSLTAGKSLLLLSDKGGNKRKALFKWLKGEATDVADFGNPLVAATYTLCVYDEIGGVPTRKLQAVIPPGGDCAGKPCWKSTARGFLYKDTALSADGIKLINLKAEAAGKAKIIVKGQGSGLDFPPLPLAQDQVVIAQVKNNLGAGECWEARFGGAPKRSDSKQFKAKGDAPLTPVPTATNTFTAHVPTSTPTATATATPTPTGPTATPTETPTDGGNCGNGYLEPGESCGGIGDLSGIECTADCQVLACNAVAPTTTFDVRFAPPLGTSPTSASILVGYRSDAVSIPGTGIVLSVRQRVLAADSYFLFTPNDLNFAVRVTVADQQPLPEEGPVFTIAFDGCSGVPVPAATEFGCIVEACAGAGGGIAGCTCEVALP